MDGAIPRRGHRRSPVGRTSASTSYGSSPKVKDVDRAEEIARHLEKALGGPPYQVQDWYELNHNLFMALKLQKLALVVILTLIILVAAVNMVSTLVMKVTEKTREIAILKAMGATSSSVALVFQVFGVAITLIAIVTPAISTTSSGLTSIGSRSIR